MFIDQSEAIAKQYIDAVQTRDAWLDGIRQAAKYRGSVYWRTTKGHDYLIKQTGRIEKSLGRRSPETEAIHKEFQVRKAETHARKKALDIALRQQERINVALRVGRVPNIVIGLINALEQAGIADHFLVIGTNALYAYETHAGVRFSGDITATTDVDLLWDSRKHLSLASHDPEFDQSGLIGILRKVDPSFSVLADDAYRAANQSGYLVDLIKRRPQSLFDDHEQSQLRKVQDDFWAAKIINMDWLLSSPKFRQVIVGVNGTMAEMITVDPRAFALFKRYIAQKEDRDPIKKPRDVAQARAVIQLIEERLPHLGFDRLHAFPDNIRRLIDSVKTKT